MEKGADVHAQARGRFFQPKDEGGYFYFGEQGGNQQVARRHQLLPGASSPWLDDGDGHPDDSALSPQASCPSRWPPAPTSPTSCTT